MKTTYFLNCIAGNVYNTKTSPALPTKFYIGLSTTAPTMAGGNVTEPATAAGYQRVEITCLSEPSDGLIVNESAIDFDESITSWGTITHFVIYDSPTRGSGNLLIYNALKATRNVEANTIMTFKADSLQLLATNASE